MWSVKVIDSKYSFKKFDSSFITMINVLILSKEKNNFQFLKMFNNDNIIT